MREIRNILEAFDQLVARGDSAVLASVIAVNGSTYRRPGARTLILPDETTIGLVSGGCLEGDLTLRAREVRADGKPRVAHYDSREESDIVWGLGLGCAGMVEVMLERVNALQAGPLEWLREGLVARSPSVVVTPLGASPSEAFIVGERLGVRASGAFEGAGPSADETRWAEAEARRCLAEGRTALRHVTGSSNADERTSRYLFEYLPPTLRLLIFGTGVDTVPLAEFALSLGWDVVVMNNRSAAAPPAHFSSRCAIVDLDPNHTQACIDEIGLDSRTAAVVMTHHYLDDREILRSLLSTSIRYIGLLGPRQRGDDLLADLSAAGDLPSAEYPAALFSPAGLDVGADSPEQIAVAVVAEIQAVFSERSGGWLRDRQGPIHEPSGE